MSNIYISPIEPVDKKYFDELCSSVEAIYNLPVKLLNVDIKAEIAYDYSREQYKSSVILKELINLNPENCVKIIGVTDVDLFVPVLTFVFGEAQLNGKNALASITRLKNEFYGMPQNEILLKSRLLKEVIHELGHTFGLYHCNNYECVMCSSSYVENIDLKSENFCQNCRSVLTKNIVNLFF